MPGALAVAVMLFASPATHSKPLDVTVNRIENFALAGPALEGPLQFLGGLALSSDNRDFGGLSGIDVAADGASVFMISDAGTFVRGRLVYSDGTLTDFAGAEIDTLFPDGDTSKQVNDVEDIAFDPSDGSKGVIVRERQANAMMTFDLEDGRPAGFTMATIGADNSILRSNKGVESVAYAPAGSPLAGSVLVIAERARGDAANIPAWIAGQGALEIVRRDDFDVSSARFLPDGDLLLLERRYSPGWGVAARLRRIAGESVKVGARLDGEILLDVGMAYQIDNMEGLAVHEDAAGRTILTLVSDDNYNILQRTLLLQFALTDG